MPVARQTQRLLLPHNARSASSAPRLQRYATGHPEQLQAAALHRLGVNQEVELLSV